MMNNPTIPWLDTALSTSIVARALNVAGVVGTVLAVINHPGQLLSGTIDGGTMWQIGLTYIVPYCVSTYSSVQALRQRPAAEQSH
jgi:hypothetical protein